MAESSKKVLTPGAVTALCTGMLLYVGILGVDASAWRGLLLIFVARFAMSDWNRGIRPLHRVHGMLPW